LLRTVKYDIMVQVDYVMDKWEMTDLISRFGGSIGYNLIAEKQAN
jgi:hypothetical protein